MVSIEIRKHQKGQALPLGIALLMFMALISIVLFNTGQTASDKTRVVNTADAAVYSGLLWQARALNFQAYTNRAMVANQVAMAQAVSLHSWAGYASKSTSNLQEVLGGIPYINAVVAAANSITQAASALIQPISKGMLYVVGQINTALSFAQKAMYISTFLATTEVVDSVVAANDPRFTANTAFSLLNRGVNINDWRTFTEEFDNNHEAGMAERTGMINSSLDKFSSNRDWRFFKNWFPTSPLTYVRAEREGTTRLVRSDDGKTYEWKAKDAVALKTKIYTWWGKKYMEEAPIGWAESFSNDKNSNSLEYQIDASNCLSNSHRLCVDYFEGNLKRAQTWAQNEEQTNMSSYTGVQAYRSLSESIRKEDKPSLQLRVEVSLSTNDIDDSNALGNGAEFEADVQSPGSALTSISTAELYFDRPEFQSQEDKEYANGYNPFWDVRLKKNDDAVRLAAYAFRATDTHQQSTSLPKLAGSSAAATPLDDYEQQAQSFVNTITTIDDQLANLDVSSPLYAQLEAQRDQLQSMVDEEQRYIQDLMSEMTDITEGEGIELLASAAGIDLNVEEYEALKASIQEKIGDIQNIAENGSTVIGQLQEEINTQISEFGEANLDSVKEQLESALTDAVGRILRGAISDTLGGYVPDAALNSFEDNLTSQIVDGTINAVGDAFEVNGYDQCEAYRSIVAAEAEIQRLKAEFHRIRENVATKFGELVESTDLAMTEERKELEGKLYILNYGDYKEIYPELARYSGEELESEIIKKKNAIVIIIEALEEERIKELATALQGIVKEEMNGEFPDYNVPYKAALQTVKTALAVSDTDIADELYIYELSEDEDQDDFTPIEPVEGCAV